MVSPCNFQFQTLQMTMISPSKKHVGPGPDVIKRPQVWVRCDTLKNFLNPQTGRRIKNMPYWILLDDGTLWFDHVTPDLQKQELLSMIREGRVYILERYCNFNEIGLTSRNTN